MEGPLLVSFGGRRAAHRGHRGVGDVRDRGGEAAQVGLALQLEGGRALRAGSRWWGRRGRPPPARGPRRRDRPTRTAATKAARGSGEPWVAGTAMARGRTVAADGH